ncbi:hypothetical protein G4B88_021770 [Cannabis sativa]|uniref:Reverse transcriptase zinc-binding domain-containing protein n=1 Tax=Cannabis sativa TaxID=3483 RepID=A0A7J6EYX8_CANSA|nr:hypothetical protein G4B88_021770 [Cannabis sativa]
MQLSLRQSDEELLNDLFDETDKELICSIVISTSATHDTHYCAANFSLWRIWSLKIPAKVYIFLWRPCCNNLPTRVNLIGKHVDVPLVCSFCQTEREAVDHVLVDRAFARLCWSHFDRGILFIVGAPFLD